jgi:hypothetical protein
MERRRRGRSLAQASFMDGHGTLGQDSGVVGKRERLCCGGEPANCPEALNVEETVADSAKRTSNSCAT